MGTFVRYWNEESLEPLCQSILDLQDDLEHRRPALTDASYEAMRGRLAILEEAARLLDEPVPVPFGG